MNNKQKTVETITITNRTKQHRDIIALVERYMPEFGTASNTLCVLLRHCPEYKEWQEQKAAGERTSPTAPELEAQPGSS